MGWLTPLHIVKALILFAPVLAILVALKTGTAELRYSFLSARRDTQPFFYWLIIAIWAAMEGSLIWLMFWKFPE